MADSQPESRAHAGSRQFRGLPTPGHAIASTVTQSTALDARIIVKSDLARVLLCEPTRRIIVTHNKRIDLNPFAVALCLGLCAIASTAGCTEERAKAVAPPEPLDKDVRGNTLMHKQLEDAIELSSAVATIEEAIDKEPQTQLVATPTYEATLLDHEGVVLKRLKTTSEIEQREPVAEASTFAAGIGRVYAFMEVQNDTDEEQVLTTNFIGPQGEVRGGVEITIPPNVPRWRTWAYSSHVRSPGQWEVEVRSEEGALLGAVAFDVE